MYNSSSVAVYNKLWFIIAVIIDMIIYNVNVKLVESHTYKVT